MAAWSMSKILVIVNVPCPKANKCAGHTLEITENGAVLTEIWCATDVEPF